MGCLLRLSSTSLKPAPGWTTPVPPGGLNQQLERVLSEHMFQLHAHADSWYIYIYIDGPMAGVTDVWCYLAWSYMFGSHSLIVINMCSLSEHIGSLVDCAKELAIPCSAA